MKSKEYFIILILNLSINMLLFSQNSVDYAINDENYPIHPGDKLEILYVDIGRDGSPIERSNIYTVNSDGYILHELIGYIKVSGYTSPELTILLRDKFSKYFNDPKVRLSIYQKRKISVLLYGEVYNPGVYSITPDTRVAEFIIQKGGTTPDADITKIIISRRDGSTLFFNMDKYIFSNDQSQNVILQEGDKIIVPRVSPEELFKTGTKNYILKYGNVIELTLSEAELSGKSSETPDIYTIDENGNIYHNLLGAVKIGGLTIKKAEDKIREIAKNYYSNPYVNINVKEISSRNVFVFGAVNRPGVYPIRGNVRVAEFLAQIGGLTSDADYKKITITRANGKIIHFNMHDYLYKRDDRRNVLIENGDRIIVPSRKQSFLYQFAEKIDPLRTIINLIYASTITYLILKGKI
ncbi:MAG: polysaccharide biosynthesis/export family protein [Candidatus Marinimicrobia bacterium]|nr:polysaccharide biosynthesis/export family protein [Candidatus Neomarinimicrobiota bacterium]